MVECLLIADDVTGACDAAGPFAARGFRTAFWFEAPGPPGAEAIAVSTESRALATDALPQAMAGAARKVRGVDARILFKKIDSTLRGNVGAEVSLALEMFGCDMAIITPAFPAMNRVVESGVLRVIGAEFQPVAMESYWRGQGLECRHVVDVRAGGRFISVDACCDADLDAIVAAGMALEKRVLWAGSAGLASALARSREAGHASACPPSGACPTLFCIGSDHPATVRQQRELLARRRAVALSAEEATRECIARALEDGAHVALWIPRGRVGVERLRALIPGGPLLVSGGDTASLVFRALGVRSIELRGEIAPGIPHGVTDGGAAVATKSGGFGGPDALIQVADTLR